MGANKDQKARRKNILGHARNRAGTEKPAASAADDGDDLSTDCPTCGSVAGEACVTPKGAKAKATHKARLK